MVISYSSLPPLLCNEEKYAKNGIYHTLALNGQVNNLDVQYYNDVCDLTVKITEKKHDSPNPSRIFLES
jgi:hypothetical protein